MSTLLKRICAPETLTDVEKAAIDLELPNAEDEGYKLPVMPIVDAIGEVVQSRQSATWLRSWITAAEGTDVQVIINKVIARTYTLSQAERWLRLGERKIYGISTLATLLEFGA